MRTHISEKIESVDAAHTHLEFYSRKTNKYVTLEPNKQKKKDFATKKNDLWEREK